MNFKTMNYTETNKNHQEVHNRRLLVWIDKIFYRADHDSAFETNDITMLISK